MSGNQLQEKTGKFINNVELKQHVPEKRMGQKRNLKKILR